MAWNVVARWDILARSTKGNRVAAPKEIIEAIRRDEYLIGVDLDPTLAHATGGLKRKLGKALSLLSEDLYSSDTHFVLELIQNADDNTYRSGAVPTISFLVRPNRIEVWNNESGFAEPHVRALCSVGESTKVKSEQLGFIGEKGIGFKSVFTISDAPEIHSSGFHFRFDLRGRKDPLGYVVPHWIDGVTDGATGTTIVLPAKDGKTFTRAVLHGVEAELLLFMRRLRVILVGDEQAAATRYARRDAAGVVVIRRTDGATAAVSRYVITRWLVDVRDLQEEKRPDVAQTKVILAFPVTQGRRAAAEASQRVFAFLPVRDYGFRFVIHGDFLLSSNREDVHREAPWNLRIRDQIAPAFVGAVETFKAHRRLSYSYYHFIPLLTHVTDEFFAPVVSEIHKGLIGAACMLTESGDWRAPGQVLQPDSECRQIIPNRELQRIVGKEYLSSKVSADSAVLDAIGCERFGMNHLLACLEDAEWVRTRAVDWFAVLYRYLTHRRTGSDAQRERLRSIKFLCLTSGDVTSLADGAVFLPFDRTRSYGFEHELRLLNAECLALGPEDAPKVSEFLRGLGVRPTVIHILQVKVDAEVGSPWTAWARYHRYCKIAAFTRISCVGTSTRTYAAHSHSIHRRQEGQRPRHSDGDSHPRPRHGRRGQRGRVARPAGRRSAAAHPSSRRRNLPNP